MKWKDSKGREWVFACNVFSMSRVKKEVGVDLSQAIKEGSTVIEDVIGDVALFFDVVSCLLKEQIAAAGLSIEEFGEGINDEDVVTDACQALVEAILDFFPPDRRRALKKAFRRIWELSRKKFDAQAKTVIDLIESDEFERIANEAVETGTLNMERSLLGGVSDSPEK